MKKPTKGAGTKKKMNCARQQKWRNEAKSLGIAGKLIYLTLEQSYIIDEYINLQGWSVCSPRAAIKAYELKLSLEQAEAAAAKLSTESVASAIKLDAVQSDFLSDLKWFIVIIWLILNESIIARMAALTMMGSGVVEIGLRFGLMSCFQSRLIKNVMKSIAVYPA